MTKKVRKGLKRKNKGQSPVKKYKDRQGKRRFHGTKHLTATQNLGSMHHGSPYENAIKFATDVRE